MISFQLWVYTKEGQIKSDEHQCLSGTTIGLKAIDKNTNWIVQLKECGEHEMEFWDYDSSVSLCNKQLSVNIIFLESDVRTQAVRTLSG